MAKPRRVIPRIVAVLALIGTIIAAQYISAQSAPPQQQPPEAPPAPSQPPPQPRLQDKLDRLAEVVADYVMRDHGVQVWRQKSALQADLVITLAGRPALEGTMIYDITHGRVRLALKDETTLVHDGHQAWVSPANSPQTDARFHLLKWSFLLAAPFKLRDRGHDPFAYRTLSLAGKPFDTFEWKLSPAATGDGEEVLRVYAHARSHLLHAVAGFTLNDTDSAGKKPMYCIVYENIESIDGVKIPTKWTFWRWNLDVEGDPIGGATLSNVKFITPAPEAFTKPTDARDDAPPAKTGQ